MTFDRKAHISCTCRADGATRTEILRHPICFLFCKQRRTKVCLRERAHTHTHAIDPRRSNHGVPTFGSEWNPKREYSSSQTVPAVRIFRPLDCSNALVAAVTVDQSNSHRATCFFHTDGLSLSPSVAISWPISLANAIRR